ncbi:hypothetical protein ACFPM3_05050 [Streptomyces coeruleoprunus]|uniref:Halobacterial output domain-containing protein n=1 Tax=Streptomyces coeruleoprunus TaxID=285563 RepID=A0ABV9XBH9_9ACTN
MIKNAGTASLEWWANHSTCLGLFPVRVVECGAGIRDAYPSPALGDEEAEGLRFLVDLSPHFTLRFDDGSTIEVEVTHSGDLNTLRLHPTDTP